MARPDRGTAERREDFQQYKRSYQPLAPQRPYFEQGYRDVLNLLNEKILNFIRLIPGIHQLITEG